jgi:hypothetical protein
MKPSRPVSESQKKVKESISMDKRVENPGGYTPHSMAEKHEIPESCNIKPRSISFVRDSIFLLIP